VSRQAREAIADRIDSIAVWREVRANQDMLGLGPEAAQRSNRSAAGLRDLADFVRSLPDDDASIDQLTRLAFSGPTFDPGASLLNELGRFRFHDPETTTAQFLQFMVTLAEQDASEQGRWGGPQIPGDDPWSPTWVVDLRSPEEEEEDW
jgi:hypothetical protein